MPCIFINSDMTECFALKQLTILSVLYIYCTKDLQQLRMSLMRNDLHTQKHLNLIMKKCNEMLLSHVESVVQARCTFRKGESSMYWNIGSISIYQLYMVFFSGENLTKVLLIEE